MISQGRTLERIRQSTYRKQNIQQHDNKRQSFLQLRQQLRQSHSDIKQMGKKTIQILRDVDHTKVQNQLKKAIQIFPFRQGSLIDLSVFTQQVYESQSLYTLIPEIVVAHISNLIEMEDQIDPFTQNLVKMPMYDKNVQKTIMTFVTQILSTGSFYQMFNKIVGQWGNHDQGILQQQFFKPILDHIIKVFSFWNCQLSYNLMMKILQNKKVRRPIYKKQLQDVYKTLIQKRQRQSIKQGQHFDSMLGYMKNLVQVKRKSYEKNQRQFFSVVKPENLVSIDQKIKTSLQSQVKTLQGFKATKPNLVKFQMVD